MKRTLGNWILGFSRRWLDDTIPAEQIAVFLEKHSLQPEAEPVIIDAESANVWLLNLPGGKVLANGKLVPGSGAYWTGWPSMARFCQSRGSR